MEGQALVAHTCNPSYSGGRDQEDHSLKPSQANNLWDAISKNSSQKIGVAEWLKVKALSSSPSIAIKKNCHGGSCWIEWKSLQNKKISNFQISAKLRKTTIFKLYKNYILF
jgi:hypothetical protein